MNTKEVMCLGEQGLYGLSQHSTGIAFTFVESSVCCLSHLCQNAAHILQVSVAY